LETLDVNADRWVLAEAIETAARLELLRGMPGDLLINRAVELRDQIGQPAPPTDAAELAAMQATTPPSEAPGSSGHVPPAVTDPAALRAWLLDVCAVAIQPAESITLPAVSRLKR
jgi:hypothetical protein